MSQARDHQLMEMLNDALRKKNIKKVNGMLVHWSMPEIVVYKFRTPRPAMVVAAEENFIEGLESLHRVGANINVAGFNKITPLMAAARRGNVEAGSWLLRHGADAGLGNDRRETAVTYALTYGKIDFLDMMVHDDPECGGSHLVTAAKQIIKRSSNLVVAQWLLEHGISPNLMDQDGHSWLGLVQAANEECIQPLTDLLLGAGANVNLIDDAGETPLHRALSRRSAPSLLRLLNAGGNPDLPDANGLSVRRVVEDMEPQTEIRGAFEAWEASCRAHQIIQCGASAHPL